MEAGARDGGDDGGGPPPPPPPPLPPQRSPRRAALRLVPALLLVVASIHGLSGLDLRRFLSDSYGVMASENATLSAPRPDHQIRRTTAACPTAAVDLLQQQPLHWSEARIHRRSEGLVAANATVVAAYFRIPSKHSEQQYDDWMRNLLSTQDAFVVFTQPAFVDTVFDLRRHAPNATVVVALELEELPVARLCAGNFSTPDAFWRHQMAVNPERHLHKSHELFWIWLSKTYFVTQAIRLDLYRSGFYMYVDMGSFRDRRYNGRRIVQHPEVVPDGTVLWIAHHPPVPPPALLWNDKLREPRHFYHSGSQAAGTVPAWRAYHGALAATLDAFLRRGLFVGEDQVVLQSACRAAPERCAYVPTEQVRDTRYRGLRTVLHGGGAYALWRPPPRGAGAANGSAPG